MLRSSPLLLLAVLVACSSAPPPPPPPTPAPRPVASAEGVAPPASAATTDPRLEAYARDRGREEGERRTLAAGYVRSARARMDSLDYEGAARELVIAAKLDPTNADAKELLERAQWNATGSRSGEFAAVARALAEEQDAKIDQLRVEIERFYDEGEVLLSKGQYDAAIQRFEIVLEKIRWSPYALDERQILAHRAEAALARAKRR